MDNSRHPIIAPLLLPISRLLVAIEIFVTNIITLVTTTNPEHQSKENSTKRNLPLVLTFIAPTIANACSIASEVAALITGTYPPIVTVAIASTVTRPVANIITLEASVAPE